MLSWLTFFTDPVLRGPTLGCMMMAAATAMVGTVTFVRQRSLIGESLAHASYPGVVLALLIAVGWLGQVEESISFNLWVLVGAFSTAILGYRLIDYMETRLNIHSDSALCFILSCFFGIGITLASQMQFTHPVFYQKIQVYFYGQAATMGDLHTYIYAGLTLFIAGVVWILFKEIQSCCFDRVYAKSIGIPVKVIDTLLLFLVVLAIVISMRSVGFILVSAMLIAPCITARCLTAHFGRMFLIAALVGAMCGYFGNYFSVLFSTLFTSENERPLSFPTGPMIVIVAALISLLTLCFAPKRGVVSRFIRAQGFKRRCLRENVLKYLWRYEEEEPCCLENLCLSQRCSKRRMRRLMRKLYNQKYVDQKGGLTSCGKKYGAYILRLHRLWELYLTEYIGMGEERVHCSAEEMEHILTPEIESKLTLLLDDPKRDPHRQPIPPHEPMGECC